MNTKTVYEELLSNGFDVIFDNHMGILKIICLSRNCFLISDTPAEVRPFKIWNQSTIVSCDTLEQIMSTLDRMEIMASGIALHEIAQIYKPAYYRIDRKNNNLLRYKTKHKGMYAEIGIHSYDKIKIYVGPCTQREVHVCNPGIVKNVIDWIKSHE